MKKEQKVQDDRKPEAYRLNDPDDQGKKHGEKNDSFFVVFIPQPTNIDKELDNRRSAIFCLMGPGRK